MGAREVKLDTNGRLFLRGMPGYMESFESAFEEMTYLGIDTVVRLTSLGEVMENSPLYAAKIERGEIPWDEREFPVEDFGVPEDEEGFLRLARETAQMLREGKRMMIHCLGGIGRTGTFAICVLMALGYPQEDAITRVKEAGSCPESLEQWRLIDRACTILKN